MDRDEDVHHLQHAGVDGHQARVAVVHEQVDADSLRSQVVHTAGAVRHIAEDDHVLGAN